MSEVTDVSTKPVDDEVRCRSDVGVELPSAAAQDSDVVWAGRVSTVGERPIEATGSVNHSQTLKRCDSRPWTTSATESGVGVAA